MEQPSASPDRRGPRRSLAVPLPGAILAAVGWACVISPAAAQEAPPGSEASAPDGAPDAGAEASPPVAADAAAPEVTAPEVTEPELPDPAGAEAAQGPSEAELDAIEAALAADADAHGDDDVRAPASTETGLSRALGTLSRTLNPDLSVILDVALAAFSDVDRALQTGGHDPTENGFALQQLEVGVSSSVDPYFRLDGHLVFGLFGVEVEEMYATTLGVPGGVQVRLGQMLTRFGRINPTHLHAWEFADQTLAIGRVFGGEGNRGLGVEVSWLTPLPWFVELIASSTSASGASTARSFFGASDLAIEGPGDLQHTTIVEQFFALSDDLSLGWGLSAAFGPNGTGRDNRTEVYGTDVYLKWRPISDPSNPHSVSLTVEWLHRRRQVPDDVLWDLTGYAQLLWRFSRRWSVAGRWEHGTPARGLGGEVAADDLDPEWTSARHRAAVSLTFWPTEFSRFRAQLSADVPTWLDDPIWAGFLTAELVAGAHGSHDF